MVFNGHATNQDLCTLMDSRVPSNDVSFPLQRKALFASVANSMIWNKILKAYNGWQYQDAGDTGNPYADIASVVDVNVIAIPTTVPTISGLSFLQNGEYKPLRPITMEEIQAKGDSIHSYKTNSGIPEEYLPMGANIYVFPASTASTAAAFRLYFDRRSVQFASTDTTATPGFETEFHPAVAIGAAMMEAQRAILPTAKGLMIEWNNWLDEIGHFYSTRFKQKQGGVINRGSDYSDEMI